MSELRSVTIHVPGEPRGKGRPRFGRTRGGQPVAYTDTKTAQYERLVRSAAYDAWTDVPTPLAVTVNAEIRLGVPKSATKRQRTAMLNGVLYPTRLDLDNVAKALLDGLNGTVFIDDRQVVELTARKFYSETPGVDVTVTEIG